MNFNSINFYLFLPAVVIIYFILRPKYRNIFLLAASFYFYMCWKAEYAVLMFLSILTTYICAIFMDNVFLGKRKLWLVLNLVINLSILFFFKYFNFTSALISDITRLINPEHSTDAAVFNVLLPVGISFYTFQALGYTIDVYRKDVPVEKSFVTYALFVSFFPQLVAGPIERSANLLPQFKPIHKFKVKNFHEGFILILWGLFKKLVIADRLAVIVNYTYSAAFNDITAAGYIIAAIAFSYQIYSDFSAYSDIARGSALILGFKLMRNFNAPYLAASVKEFWRKWHISLSTWFKDYLYFPLGGNRCKKPKYYLNLIIVFTISGLWHGANLTFVLWGLLNGIYQVIGDVLHAIRKKLAPRFKGNIITRTVSRLATFILVTYAFIFFRVETIKDAIMISSKIFNIENIRTISFSCITELGLQVEYLWVLAFAIVLLTLVDIISGYINAAKKISRTIFFKYAACFFLIVSMIIFGYYGSAYDPQEFIYFQF